MFWIGMFFFLRCMAVVIPIAIVLTILWYVRRNDKRKKKPSRIKQFCKEVKEELDEI